MTWTGGTIMIFDALTIAGMLAAALSGGFLLAAARKQAPWESARGETTDGDPHQRFSAARRLAHGGGYTPHHRGFV
jgi:hypothetical protein